MINGHDRWIDIGNSIDMDFPLESDERAIEYLANFDYDVEKAKFSLFSSLGCGKGMQMCNIRILYHYVRTCVQIGCRRQRINPWLNDHQML